MKDICGDLPKMKMPSANSSSKNSFDSLTGIAMTLDLKLTADAFVRQQKNREEINQVMCKYTKNVKENKND